MAVNLSYSPLDHQTTDVDEQNYSFDGLDLQANQQLCQIFSASPKGYGHRYARFIKGAYLKMEINHMKPWYCPWSFELVNSIHLINVQCSEQRKGIFKATFHRIIDYIQEHNPQIEIFFIEAIRHPAVWKVLQSKRFESYLYIHPPGDCAYLALSEKTRQSLEKYHQSLATPRVKPMQFASLDLL